jgi:hypothetical protein
LLTIPKESQLHESELAGVKLRVANHWQDTSANVYMLNFTESETYIIFFRLTYTKPRLIQLNGLLPKRKNVILTNNTPVLTSGISNMVIFQHHNALGPHPSIFTKTHYHPALGLGLSGPNHTDQA